MASWGRRDVGPRALILGQYRAILRRPGTAAFCAAGFVMRMPIAIYPLALVLLFSGAGGGQYGVAGVLAGTYIIGGGVGGPIIARLIDRRGQRRILGPATVVHVLAVAVLLVMVAADAPDVAMAIPVGVAGASYVAAGSLVRARWSYVLTDRAELGTAYSLESILDEVIFTVGPVIAGVLAVALAPSAGVAAGAVLVAAGTVRLRELVATEPPPGREGDRPNRSALRYRGMLLLTFSMAGMGGIFGGVEVAIAAFAGQHGARSQTGLVLAAFAVGSAIAGLLYGARAWTAPLATRFAVQAAFFALLLPLLLLVDRVGTLAAVAGVAGLGIAPTLITGFGLVDRLVPAAGLVEGLSWATTGLNFGYGAAAAVVGVVADRHGAHIAFLVPVATGVLLVAVAAGLRLRLRR